MKTRRNFSDLINERKYRVAVEIGVGHGGFSAYLLESCPRLNLFSIDPFVDCAESRDGAERNTREKLEPFGDRSKILVAKGIESFEKFEDNSIDFLYIDGEHTEPAVTEDLNAWYPKIKSGGIISGHDYGIGGVAEAVNRFTASHGFEIQLTGVEASYETKWGEEAQQASWWFEVTK